MTSNAIIERASRCVPDSLVNDYWRDGAVVVRGLFTAEEVEQLCTGIEDNIARPSPRAIVASEATDPGWFFEDFCNWQENASYESFIRSTALAAAAGRLMKSDQVRLYHDHLLVKNPGTRQKTPWHQDQPYYNVAGQQNVSLWIPVDPICRVDTLEFVAGSHLGPWLLPRTFLDRQAKWFPAGALAESPDIDADRSAQNIIGWAVEPGDAVAFHMLAIHSAAGATNRRRVFSVRLLGDDIVHAPRQWRTSPPFEGLDDLPAGAPMEHKQFPLL